MVRKVTLSVKIQAKVNFEGMGAKPHLIEDGIDVALRVGNVESLSAVARKVTSYRHKIVATPEFIKNYFLPKTPEDLMKMPCATWAKKSNNVSWQLGDNKIQLSPKIRANDYNVMLEQVLTGQYFTELPPFFCEKKIMLGELIELLPNYPMNMLDLQLVYPSRKQLSRIARVYIDFCLEHYPTR